VKEITLTRGLVALVDDVDFDWLSRWKWVASRGSRGGWYAARREGPSTILMHREIAGTPRHLGTDHRDGNTLNNQRANLRIATQGDNLLNATKRRNAKSRFKGVSAKRSKWEARFCDLRLGCFETEEAAALAYDKAAIASGSPFVLTNFMPDGSERDLSRPAHHAEPPRFSSSVRGVHFRRRERAWFVKVAGKDRGRFPTEEAAISALRRMQGVT
jgi:hypothetical protein